MTANSIAASLDQERRSATPLQAGMLFNALANPKSGVDIQQVAITLDEALDAERFKHAWQDLIRDHAILRTSFVWEGLAAPARVVHDRSAMPIEQRDWSDLDQTARENAKADLLRAERVKGFAMDAPSLMRLTVAHEGDDRWWVLWTFHHSILDGRSFPLVLERLFALYDGVVSSLKPRGLAFDDYAEALDAIDQTPANEAWRQRLAPLESPTSIDIPYQAIETAPDVPGVSAIEVRLDEATTTALLELAVENEVSLNNVIQAAWTLLLHHYSQQPTIAFGSTRAGRHVIKGAGDIIGLLINTVPFVIELDAEDTLSTLLRKMRDEQRALRPLETTPLTDIQAASSLGKTQVFDNIVMYDEATLNTRMAERLGTRARGRRFDYIGQTNFDLTLLAYAEPELLLRLEYNNARYYEVAARRILRQLEKLLKSFPGAGSTTTQAVAIDYLLDEEKRNLEVWNATDVDWDLDTTLMALFERQVERTPDTPAITFKDTTLTYRAFNARANQLAHYLRKEGVAPDQLVGLAVERSIEMELGIYGIIKAGGAFVPFDPELPVDRLTFMAEDAGVRLVLTQRHLVDRLPANGPRIIVLDGDDRPWADLSEDNPAVVTRPDQLAYALFTSGSTGTPKCAMNEHRGIVNRILWMQDAFKLDASDTVLQKTPYSFDVSVWEHFWPLQVGARLVMAEPGGHRDPAYLANIINTEKVTTIHFVPSMLQLFVEEPKVRTCRSLRRVIASGEALPRELQDRLFALLDTELHNLYGPTEAAIDVTWWACDAES
ncbi:MAG: AMP-binding protein, partial [Geminicoccaceae bacterium]